MVTSTPSVNSSRREYPIKRWTTASLPVPIPNDCKPSVNNSDPSKSTNYCAAGYRYDVSILQAEFSLTQILDRPLSGRIFFEEIIRENLDLGRPDQVQLIFDRRVSRRTPGRFRTRVLTQGVIPSLHVDYKSSRIKQYFKQVPGVSQVGARTETTVNNPRDFYLGKRLGNLPALSLSLSGNFMLARDAMRGIGLDWELGRLVESSPSPFLEDWVGRDASGLVGCSRFTLP